MADGRDRVLLNRDLVCHVNEWLDLADTGRLVCVSKGLKRMSPCLWDYKEKRAEKVSQWVRQKCSQMEADLKFMRQYRKKLALKIYVDPAFPQQFPADLRKEWTELNSEICVTEEILRELTERSFKMNRVLYYINKQKESDKNKKGPWETGARKYFCVVI